MLGTLGAAVWAQQSGTRIDVLKLDVLVTDEAGRPLNAVRVELSSGAGQRKTGETDELGHILFVNLAPGLYTITAHKAGYDRLEQKDFEIGQALVYLELSLHPPLEHRESVEVHGTVAAVEESAATPNTLPPKAARELPNRPATVADALPLTPGVVREPGGGLILSASPENRSALIVNSADVTDPATGQFGVTVPIDVVDVLNVYQTAYLPEYGRFTAGLVSVETKRGGDKWKWELNDPLPEFRIRSYHLRGLKTATPRLNFEGPLIANRLFLSEGFEYEVRKTAVYTQPFPFNQKKQEGLNSFTQLDWIATPTHLVTGTLHLAPQKIDALTLDAFNPLQTTPDSTAKNYTGTLFDRWTVWRGLLSNRLSITKFDGSVWGRGDADMIIGPAQNSGFYFADQDRTASRFSGESSYAFAPVENLGTHQIKIGGYLAGSSNSGSFNRRPVDVVDALGRLRLRQTFSRGVRDYSVEDLEQSFYAQDHWILSPRFALDMGIRTEAQQISGAIRVAPRAGFVFTPVPSFHTTFRGGFGLFYDRVPLNVYAFNRYPSRLITIYDENGDVIAGPILYVNTLGQSRVRRPFVSQQPVDGNFSPRSTIWSVQVEQPVTRFVKIRATYLQNIGEGLVTLNRVDPMADATAGALLLEGSGSSRYRQFDIMTQVRLRADRELFFSYTRSRARGDLNDFGRYLGPVPVPIVLDNYYGTLSTDLPNRFLAWGVVRLPAKMQIAPVAEWRTGFPYSALDVYQRYASIPNSLRYPNFLSIDARVSKDFQVNPKYAVRLSVSGFNLTNHFNPEAVRYNTADPAFGFFFGHRGRRFTADFDFLF